MAVRDSAVQKLEVLVVFYGVDRPYTLPNGEERTAAALVHADGAMEEIAEFVDYMGTVSFERNLHDSNLKSLVDLWRDYSMEMVRRFPHIAKLIMISLVLPMSNALVEWHFSTMSIIHTDLRNRLLVHTVDAPVTISLQGPPISEIDATTFLSGVSKAWNMLPPSEKYHSGASTCN
jgi:hypothetical protein